MPFKKKIGNGLQPSVPNVTVRDSQVTRVFCFFLSQVQLEFSNNAFEPGTVPVANGLLLPDARCVATKSHFITFAE